MSQSSDWNKNRYTDISSMLAAVIRWVFGALEAPTRRVFSKETVCTRPYHNQVAFWTDKHKVPCVFPQALIVKSVMERVFTLPDIPGYICFPAYKLPVTICEERWRRQVDILPSYGNENVELTKCVSRADVYATAV